MKFIRVLTAAVALALSAYHGIAQETVPPTSDTATLDSLIRVLKDDNLRGQFVEQLEKTRQAGQTETPAAQPAVDPPDSEAEAPDAVFQTGLLTGVTAWLSDLRQRLPTAALGAPST